MSIKKFVPLVLIVVVVIAGVAVVMRDRGRSKSPVAKTAQYNDVKACDLLTESIARKILGEAAEKGDASVGDASNDDAAVTNCVYTAEIDADAVGINNIKGVSLLSRSARSQIGASGNAAQFGELKPEGVVDVDGIGDQAYFNPQFGQLSVLQGSNWYILSNYEGAVNSGTQDKAVELAKLIEFK